MRFSTRETNLGPDPEPKSGSRGAIAVVLILVLVLAAFVAFSPDTQSAANQFENAISNFIAVIRGQNTTAPLNYTIYSPLIQNGSAKVTYPPDYSTLAQYALGLINTDRAGLNPVALSANTVAQQHADSMLKYSYFSHWDTQGLKPYMRYTLLGGKGAVAENVAYVYDPLPLYTTTSAVEGVIKNLEYMMMYNDSACCNNGHRYNILTPLHNEVSIGVAYDGKSVYFVEDFENDYITLNFSVSPTYTVTMTGTPIASSPLAKSAYITFDPTPLIETASQLNSGPREYNPGTLLGGVLPSCSIFSCPTFSSGITVHADTWVFSASQVDIVFSLHDFIQHSGAGVYTIYLITGSDTSTAVTSISVFISGA